jgi:4-hydroxy-tetrahydrodipicolinate synthase
MTTATRQFAEGMVSGCGTALVTPFDSRMQVDESALRALVDWQIEEGIDFLVPCGSTGEAATMTPEEHRRVVEITVEQVAGRVPVMAGAGSNDTARAIALSKEMKAVGATHLLHVSPMYNKPPQRGIVAHFKAIADAVELPIVAYNVPGRTGSNIEPTTSIALSNVAGIVGIKEASGNLAQITDVIRGCAEGFAVLSGDDELTLPVMALGGKGLISVISNAVPRQMTQLVKHAAAGEMGEAREIHMRLMPLMRAAFVESNPVPIKAAMGLLGRASNLLRLPLMQMDMKHNGVLREALRAAGAMA